MKQKHPKTKYELAILFDSDKKIERRVFLHEYVYVLYTKNLIPAKALIFHDDDDTLNNDPKNLSALDSNHGDYHEEKDKVFHEHNYKEMLPFLKEHFPDVLMLIKKQLKKELKKQSEIEK